VFLFVVCALTLLLSSSVTTGRGDSAGPAGVARYPESGPAGAAHSGCIPAGASDGYTRPDTNHSKARLAGAGTSRSSGRRHRLPGEPDVRRAGAGRLTSVAGRTPAGVFTELATIDETRVPKNS